MKIKFHRKWKHLHNEVGIILDVCNYESSQSNSKNAYFYEVLVKEEKIIIIERYLDGITFTEEESIKRRS